MLEIIIIFKYIKIIFLKNLNLFSTGRIKTKKKEKKLFPKF
jgi:hypothetical protein